MSGTKSIKIKIGEPETEGSRKRKSSKIGFWIIRTGKNRSVSKRRDCQSRRSISIGNEISKHLPKSRLLSLASIGCVVTHSRKRIPSLFSFWHFVIWNIEKNYHGISDGDFHFLQSWDSVIFLCGKNKKEGSIFQKSDDSSMTTPYLWKLEAKTDISN